MSVRSRFDWGEGARWLVSGVLVLVAHAAAGAIIANLADPGSPGQPEAAIVIDLAPLAAAPEQTQPDVPPGPLSEQVDAPPDVKPDEVPDKPPEPQVVETLLDTPDKPVEVAKIEPVEPVVEPPPVETPPQQQEQPLVEPAPLAPKPEVTAALPVQKPPPPPKKKTAKKPMALAAAPPAAPNVDTRATAPSQGMPSPNARQATADWNHMISAALERAKRYPAEAKSRNEQGTAVVAFSIDRSGRVLSSRLARSSGHPELDQETLATVQRANLPPAPPEVQGQRFPFEQSLRFYTR